MKMMKSLSNCEDKCVKALSELSSAILKYQLTGEIGVSELAVAMADAETSIEQLKVKYSQEFSKLGALVDSRKRSNNSEISKK